MIITGFSGSFARCLLSAFSGCHYGILIFLIRQKVNPSTLQPEGRSSLRVEEGLTAMKGRACSRRIGQQPKLLAMNALVFLYNRVLTHLVKKKNSKPSHPKGCGYISVVITDA
jgi:hypothetical protein